MPSMCRSKSSVSVRRVLAERRPAGDEDEVEAAGRVCQRQAGVVRKVQLAVRLETGWTQLPESERGIAGRRVGRDQRAALGMTEQQPVVGEVHRTGAVEEQVVHDDLRRRLPPQIEAGRPHASGVEHLNPLTVAGSVSHDDSAVVVDVETLGLNQAAFFLADIHQPACSAARGVDREHGVRAAVEHVIRAVRALLESDRVGEEAGDVWRQPADRAQGLDAQGLAGHDREHDQHDCDSDERAHRQFSRH